MNYDVNPKRRYRSDRRMAQAAETRRAILAAARTAFVSGGWQKTTIAGVARAAGVSSETIYAVFGNKRAMLEALVSNAVRGERLDTPLLAQPGPRAVAAEIDQRRQLQLFAQGIGAVLTRVAPLVAVVRSAAEADEDMAELYWTLHEGRRRNLEFVVDAVSARGPLKPGIDRKAAMTILWRLASPELFVLATGIEGSSAAAFADWLSQSLADLLLP